MADHDMDAREEELDDARILDRLRLKSLDEKKNLIEDLKKRKGQRSISLLVEILQEESWFLREQAVRALAEAGSEASGPVQKLLKDGLWYSRAAAAKALGKMGDPGAVDLLIDCLTDSNKTVQGAAASALVEIVRKTSIEKLASPLGSRSTDTRDKAISCLKLLDPGLAAEVVATWDRGVASGRPGDEAGGGRSQEESDGALGGSERK